MVHEIKRLETEIERRKQAAVGGDDKVLLEKHEQMMTAIQAKMKLEVENLELQTQIQKLTISTDSLSQQREQQLISEIEVWYFFFLHLKFEILNLIFNEKKIILNFKIKNMHAHPCKYKNSN